MSDSNMQRGNCDAPEHFEVKGESHYYDEEFCVNFRPLPTPPVDAPPAISEELMQELLDGVKESAANANAPYRYEQVESPDERVTKFWGRIYRGTGFVSRIGTKQAELFVEALNTSVPAVPPQDVQAAIARLRADVTPGRRFPRADTPEVADDIATVCAAAERPAPAGAENIGEIHESQNASTMLPIPRSNRAGDSPAPAPNSPAQEDLERALTPQQIENSRGLYFAVTENTFHDGGVAWDYIKVIRALHETVDALRRERDEAQENGAKWMLGCILYSLKGFPDGGGDIELMREVDRIRDEAIVGAYRAAADILEKAYMTMKKNEEWTPAAPRLWQLEILALTPQSALDAVERDRREIAETALQTERSYQRRMNCWSGTEDDKPPLPTAADVLAKVGRGR